MLYPTQLSPVDTALLVIDVQEKLVPLMPDANRLIRDIAFLIDGARLLELPILVTEQYPKGLGATVPELIKRLPEPRAEKLAFSSCAAPGIMETLQREARPRVVLAGMETHVCVMQTALDLLARDFHVYVAVDAVGARFPVDHEIALRRLEKAGAILISCEMCLFELLGGAQHPRFKEMSKLVQARMKAMGAGADKP